MDRIRKLSLERWNDPMAHKMIMLSFSALGDYLKRVHEKKETGLGE